MKLNLTNVYYSKKSSTCMNKDGKPLSFYSSFEEAQECANYIGNMVPYLCSMCGKFHLIPQEFYCEKIKRVCTCVDHKGQPKHTYKTKADALKMVNIRAKAGIILHVYKCPQNSGYHLSSRSI